MSAAVHCHTKHFCVFGIFHLFLLKKKKKKKKKRTKLSLRASCCLDMKLGIEKAIYHQQVIILVGAHTDKIVLLK